MSSSSHLAVQPYLTENYTSSRVTDNDRTQYIVSVVTGK